MNARAPSAADDFQPTTEERECLALMLRPESWFLQHLEGPRELIDGQLLDAKLQYHFEARRRRLEPAGVAVTYLNYPSLTHGFLQWSGVVEDAERAAVDTARLFGTAIRSRRGIANLFLSKYDDMQLPFNLGPLSAVIRNADKAETRGLELSLRAKLTRRLEASAGLGVLDTEVKEYPDSGIEGNELPRSSGLSGNFSFSYVHERGFDASRWTHATRVPTTPICRTIGVAKSIPIGSPMHNWASACSATPGSSAT